MASGSVHVDMQVTEQRTAANAGDGCVLRANSDFFTVRRSIPTPGLRAGKRAPAEGKASSAAGLDTGALYTPYGCSRDHPSLLGPPPLEIRPVCSSGLDQFQLGCHSGRLLPPAPRNSDASEDHRNSYDLTSDIRNSDDMPARTHPGASHSTAISTSATKVQLPFQIDISVEAEADYLAITDSPASSPRSTSGSSARDSVSPERSPSPPPSAPITTTTTTMSSIIPDTPSRKRAHDQAHGQELEESSPSKRRRTEDVTSPGFHILTEHLHLSSLESTKPEQPNFVDVIVNSGYKLLTPQLRFPTSRSPHEAAMELVFVQESGSPDFDCTSETSEESNEDEGDWEHGEFLSLNERKYRPSQACALPIDTDLHISEKSLAPEGLLYCTGSPTVAFQFIWDASTGAVVEPSDLVQLARRNPPYAQLQPVEFPPNSRICLTHYGSDTPLITLEEFKELLDGLPVSVDDGHINVAAPPDISGPRFPSSFPFWQCALEDQAFVFADKEEAIQASRLWIEAVQNVREDTQAYLEMTGEMMLNTNLLLTARSGKPPVRHPRLISRLVNGLYSWTPWRIPLNATFDGVTDPVGCEHASLESTTTPTFTTDLNPIERHIPELFLVTPDSDHDMGFNKGSVSVTETMNDSQALHPWRSRYSPSTI